MLCFVLSRYVVLCYVRYEYKNGSLLLYYVGSFSRVIDISYFLLIIEIFRVVMVRFVVPF